MEAITYLLTVTVTSVVAVLLWRGYRRHPHRLLGGACVFFVCQALSALLVFLDRIIFPQVDLSLWPNLMTLAGMVVLLGVVLFPGKRP